MSRILALVLVVLVGAFVFVGCGGKQTVTEQPVVTKPQDAGEETIVSHYPDPTPAWSIEGVRAYTDKKEGNIYFMGIGLPNPYEQKARLNAQQDAAEQIVRYLGNAIQINEYFGDELQNSKGFVPIQSLVQKSLRKHVSDAVVRGQYEVAIYREKLRRYENRVPLEYWKFKVVCEYPVDGLRKSIEAAKKDFEEQAKAEDLQVRDEVKKQLIEKSSKMLDAMAAQDFSAAAPKK